MMANSIKEVATNGVRDTTREESFLLREMESLRHKSDQLSDIDKMSIKLMEGRLIQVRLAKMSFEAMAKGCKK